LISTSCAVAADRHLPPPTDDFRRFIGTATVDRANPESVIDYLIDYCRVLAGEHRSFDAAAAREFISRDVARARNFAAAQNHDVLDDGDREHRPLSALHVPVLVIHGTADPMFPVAHGEALAQEIPDARLLKLDGAGHGLHREDLQPIATAILQHTANASNGG
jgi:pimeloyl-ACP methyl ester carboxylesterase